MKSHNIINNLFLTIFDKKNHFIPKITNFSILFIIIFSLFFIEQSLNILNYKIGDTPNRNILAPEDIEYIDNAKLKKKKESIIKSTAPVFEYDYSIITNNKIKINNIFDMIQKSKNLDSIENELYKLNFKINNDEYIQIKNLLKKEKYFIDFFLNVYSEIYRDSGIVDIRTQNIEKLQDSGIYIIKNEHELLYSFERIDTLNSINNKILNKIDIYFKDINKNQRDLIKNLLKMTIEVNVTYNEKKSKHKLNNYLEVITVPKSEIKKGENIIEKNKKIIESDLEKIQAYNTYIKENNNFFSFNNIVSKSLFIFFILILMYFFINIFENNNFKDFKNYIFVSLIFLTIIVYSFILLFFGITDKYSLLFGLYLPISAISLSFLFLYSKLFSISIAILLSLTIFYISGFNNNTFLFVFISSVVPIFFISKIKKRINLLIAGLKISIINIIIIVFLYFTLNSKNIDLIPFILFASTNGILSSLLAIGLIALGENVLNTPTVFRLQELTHFSNSLLKDLFNSAVGTYNHSIVVGNLAESAALEIGANELLSKVGGYYHDIGKIDNPEYFIENQGDFNKHDTLKPSISASIIKAHVKTGVIRAKKAKLPQKVIDIISQHHGNTLIRYFYEEALKNTSPDKEEISKIDFHYQNINPEFPESAIVLLADQVEAASRTIKKYTVTNIEKLVERIVDNNFQSGILDDSGLTLKDITKIKKIFSKIIIGMYHPRIEYPTSEINKLKQNNKVSKKGKLITKS